MAMMLGWKNWIDATFTTATLTGGSYNASWPITNLRTRRLGEVAKTTNAVVTSSVGVANLGASRSCQMFTFTDHNMTSAATIRIRGAASEAGLTTGSIPVDVTQNAWISPNTPDSTEGYKPTAVVLLPAAQSYPWWRFDVADAANPAGNVTIGHFGAWATWAPPHQYDIGAGSQIESYTGVEESVGQAEYFFERGNGRVRRFGISFLTDDQADEFEQIQRYCDVSRPVFFLHDALETTRWIRRSYLGRMRTLGPIEYPLPTWRGIGAEIKEWLA